MDRLRHRGGARERAAVKRYAVLLALAVVLAAFGLLLGRTIRLPLPSGDESEPRREVPLDLTVTSDDHITPAFASVPKDHRIKLSVTNRHRRQVTLTLMGYQDRFEVANVMPDSVWHGEFVADRPGESFAWILEGAPVGRLEVTGSHLVEGHR